LVPPYIGATYGAQSREVDGRDDVFRSQLGNLLLAKGGVAHPAGHGVEAQTS